MSRLITRLRLHAQERPDAPAVAGEHVALDYARLVDEVENLAARLPGRCLGLLLDNGPAWVIADLAALAGNIRCIPLPGFFTDEQLEHTVRDAGVDCLLTDQPERLARFAAGTVSTAVEVAGETLALGVLPGAVAAIGYADTAKVTYTSGSTGEPRGVCVSRQALDHKIEILARATGATESDVSLCLTPLATLLENLGGVYVPLLAGALCRVPRLSSVGLSGSSGLDVARLISALNSCRPSSVIVIPQQLRAMLAARARGASLPDSLRFIAVGGAPVARELLLQARRDGLPVYQGYGLSEAVSVVALNTPGANRIGSTGRPLPGLTVRIAEDGEIMVRGDLFSGYLGDRPRREDELATGDLGYLDTDGYLYVTGRKKNAYATAYGRNVSPEWIEGELLAQSALAQVVVFGESSPVNIALIVAMKGARAEDVVMAVEAANRSLPDYARVGRYVLAAEPFTIANGQLTGTGRPRRDVVARRYADVLRPIMQEAV
ncbi:MAG: AMP-binding protein [Gammaproteobacteria bacterium]